MNISIKSNNKEILSNNLHQIKTRIAKSALISNRKIQDITFVAVTKYAPYNLINEVITLGVDIIGENRVQEFLDKADKLKPVKKHFIGTLQTNKVKIVVSHFDVIQSVDSLKLANEINKESYKINKIMPIFLEVNIGKEETKHGILPEDLMGIYNKIIKLQNIKILGLMCIAPFFEDKNIENVRPYFRQMKNLQKIVGVKELSMGMSADYKIALEEGSTLVRVGTAIFGDRNYPTNS